MSKAELDSINREWTESMQADHYPSFFTYQPFSDEYWKQTIKVVLCNLESYDDTFNGEQVLDRKHFSSWLDYNKGTTRLSAVYLVGLKRALDDKKAPNEKELRDLRFDDNELLADLETSMYMNLRKEPGTQVEEDEKEIHQFLDPRFHKEPSNKNRHNTEFFRQFLKETEADVLLIAGVTGADILNKVFGPEFHIQFGGTAILGKTRVFSIEHPSRTSYAYIAKKIDEVLATSI